jgi:hypothetical protein
MRRALPGFRGLCYFFLVAVLVQTSAAPAGGEYWLSGGTLSPAPRVQLTVPLTGTFPADAPLAFECVLTAQGYHPETRVDMVVSDGAGVELARESLVMTLYNGPNECRFLWAPEGMATASYTIDFTATYPGDDPASMAQVQLRKVEPVELRARMDRLHTQIALLDSASAANAAERGSRPYLSMRLALAAHALDLANHAFSAGHLRDADAFTLRAESLSESAQAQLTFDAGLPSVGIPGAAMPAVDAREGAFVAGERPVFLFGAALDRVDAEEVTKLASYGFNFAVLPFPPTATVAGADAIRPGANFDAALQAAESRGLAVLAQLLPHEVGAQVVESRPDIQEKGFVDLAHPVTDAMFSQHMSVAGPYLAAQPAVRMVSLAFEPRFNYDSETVRRQFIEHIRQLYPDRHDLNLAWRTHLATFDEITISGDFPEHDYHHKRAYQWDWQQFHQGLAQEYLQGVYSAMRALAPALPATITLPNTVFQAGDSRRGVDREGLARMLEITGCTASLNPESELYAYSYPDLSAFATLMRSMEPGKPVICTEYRIEISPSMSPPAVYDYVYASTWDAVVSGLNGMALPAGSPVFARPEALEAYAMAALDINRLAPVVQALQAAPAEVGILWSDSSKVLDDGEPYLTSTRFAYEGISFSGYQVRFITERQAVEGALDHINVLVVPETPALREGAFKAVQAYMEAGGVLAQVGTPIPYDEHGQSRQDLIRPTGDTFIVRGQNLPTEYLHAMDAILEVGQLEHIPRPINRHGYPLEGVKTRFVTHQGESYVFVVNLRNEPVNCHLAGTMHTGRDLITNQHVYFPRVLPPLKPMLILMDNPVPERVVTAQTDAGR